MKRLLFVACGLLALVFAPAALAHVTAQPFEQTPGSFTKIAFRMPNERPVPTVKLEVQLPPELDGVLVQPVPGWTYKITRSKLEEPREVFGEQVTDYVSSIEWTGRLGVTEFQEFPISMRLPEQGDFGDYILFPAVQMYANGEVVRWIQKPESPDGSFDDLDNPSPRVQLVAAEEEQPTEEQPPAAAEESAEDDEEDDGQGLGIAALIIAAIALVAAALAFWRPRRT